MSMRVSSFEIANSSLYDIESSFERFNQAQTVVSSGEQLQQPSDNPTGIAELLQFQAQNSDLTQYTSNIDQAKSFLSATSSALASVTNLAQQARSIAVQGANDSSDANMRTGLANQLQNIITQLVSIGNSSYDSRYLFAGQRTQTTPIVESGSSYSYAGGSVATGDANLDLTIGQGETITMNVTGDTVFTPLLSTLQSLQTDIANGNLSAVSKVDLANIDTQLNSLSGVNADVGSKVDRLQQTEQRYGQMMTNFTQFISQIQDANVPKAVIALQTAQTTYQAALEATSRDFQDSLLNFLH